MVSDEQYFAAPVMRAQTFMIPPPNTVTDEQYFAVLNKNAKTYTNKQYSPDPDLTPKPISRTTFNAFTPPTTKPKFPCY